MTKPRCTNLTVRAYVDGACRGNPGPGACGGHIEWSDGHTAEFAHVEHGTTTNIRQELMAVIGAIYAVKKALRAVNTRDNRHRVMLFIYSDCQNVVQCATGAMRVHANRDLWQQYTTAVRDFPGTVAVQWIPREQNTRADAIVSRALRGHLEGVLT